MRPGTYSLRVTAPGFSSQVRSEIEIHVQSRPSADFTLKVGEVSGVMEVRTAARLLQTQTADMGGAVQEKQIDGNILTGAR